MQNGKLQKIVLCIATFIFFILTFVIILIGLENERRYNNIVRDKFVADTQDEYIISDTKENQQVAYESDKPDFLSPPTDNEYMYDYYNEDGEYLSGDGVNVRSDEITVEADELVEWAFRAYNEEWEYVYGGCEEGHVDCSGLIKSKVEVCARGTEELLAESELNGTIDTIPEIPGLGVYMNGHVGVYVGEGMVIDARTEASGIGYDAIDYEGWTHWFEIKGVDYSKYVNYGAE